MNNPIDWIQGLAFAGVVATGAAGALWFLRSQAPGMIVKKIHKTFESIRSSSWINNKNHPKRARWLLATLELIEEEIPNPGTDRAFYDGLGQQLSDYMPIVLKNPKKWADALEKIGDSIDTEISADIKEISA